MALDLCATDHAGFAATFTDTTKSKNFMDYAFTTEQQDIRKAAREFAKREFPIIAREIDEKETFPRELWKKACELGLIGCFIPEEYGGAGYGLTEHCCISEEFFRVDPGCGQ
jgi:alkylation response protein AidB-like acyl-CoA dehydrogenase